MGERRGEEGNRSSSLAPSGALRYSFSGVFTFGASDPQQLLLAPVFLSFPPWSRPSGGSAPGYDGGRGSPDMSPAPPPCALSPGWWGVSGLWIVRPPLRLTCGPLLLSGVSMSARSPRGA